MIRKLFFVVSILSVLVLGIIILLPGNSGIDPPEDSVGTPEEQLNMFMIDKMNYGLRLPRILAERRIEMAREFAAENPALEVYASEVIDSLTARLERKAKM